MKQRRLTALVAFLLLCSASIGLFVLQSASAVTADFVPTRFDDPVPDGCLPADCSLREAIVASEAAAGANSIFIPAGTYTLSLVAAAATLDAATSGGTANSPAVGDLDLRDTVTITGAGAGVTIIDAGGIDRVFDLDGAFAYIGNLTVRNGLSRAGFRSHSHGGAIHNHGNLTLSQVAVSGSDVASGASWGGGGLTNAGDGTALLENVTFAGNTTQSYGGGIENGGSLKLFNVTISGNTAPAGQGGGISNGKGFFAAGTARLNNTIVAGNTGGDCVGTMTSVGHNLAGDASCTGLTGTGDLTSTNPMLDPITDTGGYVYLYALLPGSPAIDAGSGAYSSTTDIGCGTVDQRGVARPQDGNGDGTAVCDIGAYEFVADADLSLTKTDSPDPVAQDGELTYTISVKNNGPGGAAGVTVTDTLPPSVTFVSASAGCSGTTTVTCNLGSLANGQTKVVTIVVKPKALGQISNTATVSSSTPDPTSGNNSATAITTVKIGCAGAVATIIGSRLIYGTPGPDVIVGSSGTDIIQSFGGADRVCGLAGDDMILGGAGNDFLDGGDGNDNLTGEAGNDVIFGGFGNDGLYGNSGNDALDGDAPTGTDPNANVDSCSGGAGADTSTNCELVDGT